MSTRRKYTADFKREAVELSYQEGSSVVRIAQELGINPNILYRWRVEMRQEGREAFPGHGNIKASEKEFSELKKELARVKQERDILKKALSIFSQGQ
jgi:transposase